MPQNTLQKYFGFSKFREGQQEVITSILEGRSAAAIFPTGSGKSLCYQLPALHLKNLTVVVSPLLALIQDQIDFLIDRGIPAVRIDSSLSKEEEQEAMEGIRTGKYKILMISVERFKNERFRRFLEKITISLMVVDEAHCISEWGHNFRPDYLKLPTYQKDFNIPQVLLLTATATPKVIEDMSRKFNIQKEDIMVTGFYRPNLRLEVKAIKQEEKDQVLSELLRHKKEEPSIVYVTLQKTAEDVARALCNQGIKATAYHAGMKSEEREAIQNNFMAGTTNCIVATIAFGMGIDKSNIRNVIHYDLPKSIENYSQEIGRAGRDGNPSECIVLANRDNVNVLENFVYGDTPEKQGIRLLLEKIKAAGEIWEVKMIKLPGLTNIRILPIKTLLVYLEMKGIIRPMYSYFADYRFSNNISEEEIISKFKGERQQFIRNIFDGSEKARKWTTVNFENLYQNYNAPRDRVVAALEYFEQQRYLNLEAKQMVDVFSIIQSDFDIGALTEDLYLYFRQKENIEVGRIANMLELFESKSCLSTQLAAYFGEQLNGEHCGHCSVCNSGGIQIPGNFQLKPLDELDFKLLTSEFVEANAEMPTSDLITRFLCGINVPSFTRLKAKKMQHFASLEQYRYAEVRNWVEDSIL
ncbi:MAG: ATP-dependent DNA helicase RecQ [Marinifilaceae bacterium]